MRTTLSIDNDVLEAAKTIAKQRGQSLGEVVSAMIRKSIEPIREAPATRNGIPLFPISSNTRPVTPEIIAGLLEDSP